MLHLCQRNTFDAVWSRVLPLLSLDPEGPDHEASMPAWAGVDSEEGRLAFRYSLAVSLYGWEVFHSLRLRLAIADYCWVTESAPVLTIDPSNHTIRTAENVSK